MPQTQLDLLITKLAAVAAGVSASAGFTLASFNLALSTFFLGLACISTVLIIAVNWDKGIARIKQAVYLKHKNKGTDEKTDQ